MLMKTVMLHSLGGDSLQRDLIPGQVSTAGRGHLDDDNTQGYLVLYLDKNDASLLESLTGKRATEFEVL